MGLDPSQGLGLFTDGSSWTGDRSGGWAWCLIDAFEGEETGSGAVSDTTNNRMEMMAWIEGLNTALEIVGKPCDILVYSDSQYVGLGVMDRSRRRKFNVDLWGQLDQAVDQHDLVEFCWVKGHEDSYYNVLVDELAGLARKNKC